MAKITAQKLRGLLTAPNSLTRGPGSLSVARNAIVPVEGTVRKRQGIRKTATATAGTQITTHRLHSVAKSIGNDFVCSINVGDTETDSCIMADSVVLYRKNPLTVSPHTNGSAITLTEDPANLPFEQYRQTVSNSVPTGKLKATTFETETVFTTGAGLQKIEYEGLATYRRPVGLPRPTVTHASPEGGGTATVIQDGYACLYAAVLGFLRDDGKKIYGPPSSPFFLLNENGADSTGVNVYVTIPPALLTYSEPIGTANSRWFLEIYRGKEANVGADAFPDGNLYKVDEIYLAADVLDGTSGTQFEVLYQDFTPPSPLLLREPLYTNTLDGDDAGFAASGSNEPPENFAGVFGLNGTCFGYNWNSKHSLTLSLIALPANNETITIAGTTYTFKTTLTTPHVATEIQAVSGGTLILDLHKQAQLIVKRIMRQSAATDSRNAYVTARIIGSPGDGGIENSVAKILFEHKKFPTFSNDNSFLISFGNATIARKFSPFDSESTNNRLYSKSKRATNSIMFTRPGLCNAWWPAGEVLVGQPDNEILSATPLLNGAVIWTTKGVYWMDGTNPFYRARLVNDTIRLLGPECAAQCYGAAYGLTNFGAVRVSAGGQVSVIDDDINDKTRALAQFLNGRVSDTGGTELSSAGAFCFVSADNNTGRVYFWVPDTNSFDVGTP